MAAWLKQLDPKTLSSKRLPLQGTQVLGRDVRVVHQGFWRLLVPGQADQLLHLGQLISAGGVDYVFGEADEARDSAMEAAIAAAPGDAKARQVYADWLLERGDPFGERLLRPRSDDAPWLEGLSDEVEVTWRDGAIDRVVIRDTASVADPGALRRTLTRVLSLRAACFLKGLVVDLQAGDSRLAAPQLRGAKREETIALRAEELLRQLPALPALETLSLGYCLTPARPPAIVVSRSDPRFPRLDPAPVFSWAPGAVFNVLEARALDGARPGARLPAAGLRLRRLGSRVLLAGLDQPRGAWGWASASEVAGRVLLSLHQEMQTIEVNGRSAPQTFLLPGDVLDVFAGAESDAPDARLRFELER